MLHQNIEMKYHVNSEPRDIYSVLFYYKFHKYILVWNEVETSGLAANSYKKYIDIGYNRIITHLTEIM